jgi:hypothetical protein
VTEENVRLGNRHRTDQVIASFFGDSYKLPGEAIVYDSAGEMHITVRTESGEVVTVIARKVNQES